MARAAARGRVDNGTGTCRLRPAPKARRPARIPSAAAEPSHGTRNVSTTCGTGTTARRSSRWRAEGAWSMPITRTTTSSALTRSAQVRLPPFDPQPGERLQGVAAELVGDLQVGHEDRRAERHQQQDREHVPVPRRPRRVDDERGDQRRHGPRGDEVRERVAGEQQPDHPSSATAGPHGVGARGGVEAEQHGDDAVATQNCHARGQPDRPVQEEGQEQRDVDRADQRRERRPVAPRGGEEPGPADRP